MISKIGSGALTGVVFWNIYDCSGRKQSRCSIYQPNIVLWCPHRGLLLLQLSVMMEKHLHLHSKLMPSLSLFLFLLRSCPICEQYFCYYVFAVVITLLRLLIAIPEGA